MWRSVLATPANPSPYVPAHADDWLCAIANAESDIKPYLAIWLENETSASNANLIHLVQWNSSNLLSGNAPAGYWEGAQIQWGQLVAWLTSAALRERLVRISENLEEIDLAVGAEECALLLSKTPTTIQQISALDIDSSS